MTDPDGPAAASTGPEGSAVPATDLSERVVDSRVVHKGHYMEFRVDTIERADGTRGERDIVGHPGAVAMLAIDEADRVLMVRQFRLAARDVLLEIPAGTLDVDAATGAVEDPEVASRRELEEETGYRARSWRKLGSFWTAPGFATELMHLYLATDLEPASEGRLGPDEDERLELERVPVADALAMAERGEIVDAKSLVALLWYDRLRRGMAEPMVPSGDSGPRIEVRFQPSRLEAIDATAATVRRSIGATLIGLAGVGFGVLGLLTYGGAEGWFLVVLGVLLVSGLIAAPFVLFTAYRAPDLVTPSTTVTITPGGIDYSTPRIRSEVTWDLVRRVRLSGRYLFFETGASPFYLPKRAFSEDQLAGLQEILAAVGFGPDGRRQPGSSR